jgi:hypothetical protein
MANKILAIMLLIALVFSIFKKLFLYILIILSVYLLIRLGAIIYWWGKDNHKW